MTAKEIQKYKKKSIPQLIKIATLHFNRHIRERDKLKGCISCGGGVVENAGHYLNAGQNSHVRFNEKNVHGQCIACNKWKHGNLIEYRKGLVHKIGESEVLKLEFTPKTNFKWDRFSLIQTILKYKK